MRERERGLLNFLPINCGYDNHCSPSVKYIKKKFKCKMPSQNTSKHDKIENSKNDLISIVPNRKPKQIKIRNRLQPRNNKHSNTQIYQPSSSWKLKIVFFFLKKTAITKNPILRKTQL